MTALKEGTTIITVTTEDGNKTATCTITVKKKANQEDDIYYPQKKENNVKDTTIATGTIPQTGVSYLIAIAAVSIIVVSGVVTRKQYKKYKDVK